MIKAAKKLGKIVREAERQKMFNERVNRIYV